jgi:hypothetical protein
MATYFQRNPKYKETPNLKDDQLSNENQITIKTKIEKNPKSPKKQKLGTNPEF